jgi:hypothetical protein
MKRLVQFVLLVVVGAAVSFFALGSLRFGGPSHFLTNARAAMRSGATPPPATQVARAPAEPTPAPTLAPTATPSPTATTAPTLTPTATHTPEPTATPTETPTPAYAPPLAAHSLTGFRHEWQGWNNCGPVTMGMNLSYYGLIRTQFDVAAVVRPHPDDKHVGPEEMAAYARAQGMRAMVRENGSLEMLKTFVSNDVPIVVASWYETHDGDAMGHYRLVTGFDDAAQEFTLYDSLRSTVADWQAPYHGIRISYAEMERLWGIMNYRYIPIYPEDRAAVVEGIIGEDMDDAAMWARSLARAEADAAARPEQAFSWFVLGSNLAAHERWEEAVTAYERAREIGLPHRTHWYTFGPYEAYYRTGRYAELIALADANLAGTQGVEEIYYWRGLALRELGDSAAARQAFQAALALRQDYPEAQEALSSVAE